VDVMTSDIYCCTSTRGEVTTTRLTQAVDSSYETVIKAKNFASYLLSVVTQRLRSSAMVKGHVAIGLDRN